MRHIFVVLLDISEVCYVWFRNSFVSPILGPHFLCLISGVFLFNTWLISSWEENKCCYKLSKCTKWHLFHSKWSELSFWVKIVVILSVAQLETAVIFFSAWDKSHVKWDNSRNSTQIMRTLISTGSVLFRVQFLHTN